MSEDVNVFMKVDKDSEEEDGHDEKQGQIDETGDQDGGHKDKRDKKEEQFDEKCGKYHELDVFALLQGMAAASCPTLVAGIRVMT